MESIMRAQEPGQRQDKEKKVKYFFFWREKRNLSQFKGKRLTFEVKLIDIDL